MLVNYQLCFIFTFVNVINRRTLKRYYAKHTDAKNVLETWYKVCRKADWKNFNEVKQYYPSADQVGDDRMIFNIIHNKYRLIVRFSFRYKIIQLKWFGTHGEYKKIDVLKV